MKLRMMIELDIEPTSTLGKILREKALIVFRARKSRQEKPDLDRPDLKAEFDALTPKANEAVKSMLPFADFDLIDVQYDSLDVVSKEEEAIILAPPG